MKKTGMHWFRTDLRIHDNPALYTCLDEVERFIPIFIFDGKTAGKSNYLIIKKQILLLLKPLLVGRQPFLPFFCDSPLLFHPYFHSLLHNPHHLIHRHRHRHNRLIPLLTFFESIRLSNM